jgi:hypothetical protein
MMNRDAIRAIETEYQGYRFRSRLEARWAVFFDALGVRYEYEKEGYDLGEAGWYLPDFWLPDCGGWVEIKPGEPTRDERDKLHALVGGLRQPLVLLEGVPDEDEYGTTSARVLAWDDLEDDWLALMEEDPEDFGGDDAVAKCLRDRGMVREVPPHTFSGVFAIFRAYGNPFGPGFEGEQFWDAIRAARSARFEHGRSGRAW